MSKHFLSITDFDPVQLAEVLAQAGELKTKHRAGERLSSALRGKTLAMIFQKPSNRTRVSFEVGMTQLGGTALNIRPEEIDMGKRESVADVAQVMARYVDGVMLRVMRHTDLLEYACFSSVPVINGLSDLYHPCQALADMQTIAERKGGFKGLHLCYVGDGNNVANSLIQACALLGTRITVSCPSGYDPSVRPGDFPFENVRDPRRAIAGADVVYTDVWTSMGQEEETLTRLRVFEKYSVTPELFALAAADAIFMHCLPAHRGEEVHAAVIDSPRSVVVDQAENRLHAQKALLLRLLG